MALPNCACLPGNRLRDHRHARDRPGDADALRRRRAGLRARDRRRRRSRSGPAGRCGSTRSPRAQLVWGALSLVKRQALRRHRRCSAHPRRRTCSRSTSRRGRSRTGRRCRSRSAAAAGCGAGAASRTTRATRSILVVTGDALPGGTNVGKKFNESAGYAEHLVQSRARPQGHGGERAAALPARTSTGTSPARPSSCAPPAARRSSPGRARTATSSSGG